MPMPYPHSSKSYGGGGGSSGVGYSSPYMSGGGFAGSSMLFGRHDFARSQIYGGATGLSLNLGFTSNYSIPTSYSHVSPYGVSSYSGYGSYAPTSAPKSFYSPLPTITEHSSSSPSSSNKRRIPRTYIPVLPLPSPSGNRPALYTSTGVKTLFTEDIDVTTPRNTAKPADINRERNGEGYGTIRRGRTVIRLETKKLKENPYLPPAEGGSKKKEKAKPPPPPEEKATNHVKDKEEVLQVEVENAPAIPAPAEAESKNEILTNGHVDEMELAKEQFLKDYSHVKKWYDEEIRIPIKKEKNAGDKFREKYMVHSRKNKYAGYRRPTLSDIRAQKAVVMKEIEERLRKLTESAQVEGDLPEDLKAEAEKLEKDKEKLAKLDKKMAKRFSRALRKAEQIGAEGDSSDDDGIDRQATLKAAGKRKISAGAINIADLPPVVDGIEGGPVQGGRLTRKITKRFFFPQEASSVVEPEIIETLDPGEPEDLFEKNILAQRQTVKTMRSVQKKAVPINSRKSSASDLEIPGELLSKSDKLLCDGEAKMLEPTEEVLEEEDKSPKNMTRKEEYSPFSSNCSGKKKKLVKKVGDPPAKRVPGNILQPLVVTPKDSDSILESPTEEDRNDKKEVKQTSVKSKAILSKVNGLISAAQQKQAQVGAKPQIGKIGKIQPNKDASPGTANVKQPTSGVGNVPDKKAEQVTTIKSKDVVGVKQEPADISAKMNSKTDASSSNSPKGNNAITITETEAKAKDEKMEAPVLPTSKSKPEVNPKVQDTQMNASSNNMNTAKPAVKIEEVKNEMKNAILERDQGKAATAEPKAEKKIAEKLTEESNKSPSSPLIAKLKPKLALDNKSASFDNNAKPKFKLDNKSSSFDGRDDNAKSETKVTPGLKKATDKPTPESAVQKLMPTKNEKLKSQEVSNDNAIKVQKDKTKPEVEDKILPNKKEDVKVEKTEAEKIKPTEVAVPPKKETSNCDQPKKPTEDESKLKKETPQELKKKPNYNAEPGSPGKQTLVPVKVQEAPAKEKNEAAAAEETRVKTEQVPPEKKELLPPNDKLKSELKSPPPSPKAKVFEKKPPPPLTTLDKVKAEVKSPPPSPKTKVADQKEKVELKSPPPGKNRLAAQKDEKAPVVSEEKSSTELKEKSEALKVTSKLPDESKDKPIFGKLKNNTPLGSPKEDKSEEKSDKSENLSSLLPCGAQSSDEKKTQMAVENESGKESTLVKENKHNLGKGGAVAPATEKNSEKTAALPPIITAKPLQNGHLSPPPSSKEASKASMEQPTSGEQHQSKSPHPSETTQKEGAKVENLGCSAEKTTNGPEKGKVDDDNILQDSIRTQMNKLGAISAASENIAGDFNKKLNSTEIATVEPEKIADNGGVGNAQIEPLANPIVQSLIRNSIKRASTQSSGSSSISSGSSTSTAKTESGSSTSSTLSAASLSGSRRAPSPPLEDMSEDERITLDKICPAKTRPKYRKYEIEDFQFLKVLGKGSFGKVLLAELKGSDSYFAIKCLKKDVVLEDDDVECTMIERKVLLMGSKHPYLCHLFCTFQTESHLFFVMEYLNGGDLMFHIQQSGRFAEERARFYGAEIVSGLKFLHKRGVIYRDLKLDNILLDYEGHIRIADFGMCKLQIYLDRMADTFCGTPDYMSPEIIKGLRYNQCVDWWAFGVLMYEMLIGQSPFSGHDEDELFWSICNEPVHYPRFLCKEAKRLLELLLEKDASKRLGTVGCVHGDVKEQPFFQPIDWERLEKRDLEPPFKPKLKHSLDVQYFDTTFTKEAARLTPVDKEILRSMDQTQFEGFSYTNPHTTD